jgi:hypothetical protein
MQGDEVQEAKPTCKGCGVELVAGSHEKCPVIQFFEEYEASNMLTIHQNQLDSFTRKQQSLKAALEATRSPSLPAFGAQATHGVAVQRQRKKIQRGLDLIAAQIRETSVRVQEATDFLS